METDIALRKRGTKVLIETLGETGANRFFKLIQSEPFDYTEWQENLLNDVPVEELSRRAMEYRKTKSR